MGIDIRNGGQIECINCGLCIDACDGVMARVDRPAGLIAYDTDAAVAARKAGRPPVYRLVRTRTIYYGVALALVSSLMAWGLATRPSLAIESLRDRNPTFVRLHDGSIRNGYTLKIDNRSFEPRAVSFSMSGLPGALLQAPGGAPTASPIIVTLDPNQVRAVRILVRSPAPAERSTPVTFVLKGPGGETVHTNSTFLSGDVASQ